MRSFLLIFFVAILMGSSVAQEQLAIRRKIVPLHSTRNDVEKVAKFIEDFNLFVRYETDSEFINVYYTKTRCDELGWNVGADFVHSYRIYPKQDLILTALLKTNKQFFQIGDDTLSTHYINAADGIEFVGRYGEEKVEYIGFFPTFADFTLRCAGFPKYDLISQHYPLTESFTIKDPSSFDVGLMATTFSRLQKDTDQKGYAFVYCQKGQITKCNELKKRVEKYASKVLNSEIKRFTVSVGGYRDNLEIESFLVPKDYPAAVARPKYPSK